MHKPLIERVKLKYFKCHDNLEEEMKNITILAGENGAGKSTIIQSLLLHSEAMQNENEYISTFQICGSDLGSSHDIASSKSPDEGFEISLVINGKEESIVYAPIQNNETLLKVNKAEVFNQKYNMYYLNAERMGPRLFNGISNEVDYVGAHGENTIYIMNQIDLLVRTSTDMELPQDMIIAQIKRFSANCEAWLDYIIPGVEFRTTINAAQGMASIEYNTSGENYYVPTATGFGITYALPIVVQALIATMKKESILIVENPEAHLHPFSQSRMGKFLAHVSKMGVQVIIETHSEHIINGCRLQLASDKKSETAKIMFFFKEGKKYIHENILLDKNGELSSWPRKFFDQNQQDLKELLQLKICKK